MTKSETTAPNDIPHRRLARIGERQRTQMKRYSNPSDSFFEHANNAIIAASIVHSAALPLDCRPATNQLPAHNRSIPIAAAR